MTNFRTDLPNLILPFAFNHSSPVMCIGSCFAQNIGDKMKEYKFPSMINPFGILYNPHSIGNALGYLLGKQSFEKEDLVSAGGLWHSFDHHGHFSKVDASEVLTAINDRLKQARAFLNNTQRMVLTLGTSNVFVYKRTGKIVANCHKLPNHEFERKTLSVEEILKKLSPLLEKLKAHYPSLEVLLTVSPVRHLRDGLVENQRSKARLLLACEQLSNDLSFVHYFPAYEIMMDDLRDYRFYDSDMIHPNEVAIDYIWKYFGKCFFDAATIALNVRIAKIVSATKHRPFHPQLDSHQLFLKKQIASIEDLKKEFNFLDFEEELRFLEG